MSTRTFLNAMYTVIKEFLASVRKWYQQARQAPMVIDRPKWDHTQGHHYWIPGWIHRAYHSTGTVTFIQLGQLPTCHHLSH